MVKSSCKDQSGHKHSLIHVTGKNIEDALAERLKLILRPSATIQFMDNTNMNVARIEDEIVGIVRSSYDDFILHGGTAIWRCYGGHRFSTDLDFITNLSPSQAKSVQKDMRKTLIASDYIVQKEWYSEMDELLIDPIFTVPNQSVVDVDKTSTLHMGIFKNNVSGRIDITFMTKIIRHSEADYLEVDGSRPVVKVLGPEALLKGKLDKYRDKFTPETYKVQDLYDMAIIKSRASALSKHVSESLELFLEAIRDNPPKNVKELQLISGTQVPSFLDILSILEM